ncbi:hypothetical protein FB382_000849 [Nocardioides ginsengisegetis]|uniref:Uncharacterized protein n=1 Tax=Nocardioides ginsengisegetis TaxID=661491 RepID=A0A7W3P8L0_9ACTN|nr:MXAN_6640 family putative metalloprotease [Nocardioides ginsengisegetis]MBA8802558.1 hypothetical protein [Nocardioides ginsengisegetis]
MRRSIAAAVVAMATALTVLPATTSSAIDGKPTPGAPAAPSARVLAEQQATRALTTAHAVLAGTAGASAGKRPEGTLAMRDLFTALPDLDASQQKQAHAVLARPTDGAGDPYGDGYTVPAKRKCQGNFCIHWVPTTSDAPPSQAWVTRNLAIMNKVWHHHVTKMGYRAPVQDGSRGGNKKFDVYLKDVGAKSLYGYCAPEKRKPGTKWLASGFCVLDNDFSQSQFGAPPINSLKVTAAHEFFHAVQFAYDYGEDSWFMEATATWMEERFADDVNDNRQYLPYGQVKLAGSQLDFFNQDGFNQYGNWPFFEYLSTHYGNGVVRTIWNRAGAFKGAPDLYSTKAIRSVLGSHGGFPKVFRSYAAGNTVPARTYPEGKAWPHAVIAQRWKLSKDSRNRHHAFTVDHMASANALLKPDASLSGPRWMARITIDAPGHKSSPGIVVIIKKKSGTIKRSVHLTRGGYGKVKVPFSSGGVRSVTVTMANASTRFQCWHRTAYSCQGKPVDNNKQFTLKVSAFKR